MDAYTAAGVNVDVEADASRILFAASRETFANRTGKIGEIIQPRGNFAGVRYCRIAGLAAGSCTNMNLDGVGTKIEVYERIGKPGDAMTDVVAMCADDAAVKGLEPAHIGVILDITSFGKDASRLGFIRELATGYSVAGRAAGVSIVNGEIAQLGARVSGYGDFPYNLGGVCVWFGKEDRILDGSAIRPGDHIVAVRERGFRSNGISLVRKEFTKRYGPEWHKVMLGNKTLGEQVGFPSIIYSRLLVHLHGGYAGEPTAHLSGAVHITGGGIPEKLGRLLSGTGCGAILENLWEPCPAMSHCLQLGNVSDSDGYRSLNMGQGLLLITRENPERVADICISRGHEAIIAGMVTDSPGISLCSNGPSQKGTWFQF